ncbi:TPA: hypothetical protein ACSTNG_001696 [Serratia fonticola]
MNLMDFCITTYQEGNRSQLNGVEANHQNVATMVGVVFSALKEGYQPCSTNFPPIESLLEMELSPDGSFDSHCLPDLIGLVFDVVTDRNRNPELWYRRTNGIESEISYTFAILIHGPMGHITPANKGAANGKVYDSVKNSLINDLDSKPFGY